MLVSLHNMVPLYVARDLCWTDKSEALQCLRSGSHQRLIMPQTRLHMIGDCSFCVWWHGHGTIFFL